MLFYLNKKGSKLFNINATIKPLKNSKKLVISNHLKKAITNKIVNRNLTASAR